MLNQVVQMGRLTADPELRQTVNGVKLVNFSIAVERDYATETGKRDVDFFDVVAWRETAEFISRNFRKGRLIVVSGRLENQLWKDKYDNNRVTTKIVAEKAYFAGDYEKRETYQQTAPAQTYAPPAQAPQQAPQQAQQMRIPNTPPPQFESLQNDDDLPF